jgi:uncharacterized protein
VLIAGISTRAAADSAARAGFDVIALDAYADLDQDPSVRALSLPRDFGAAFSPEAIVEAGRELTSDVVVYLSNLENHPQAVDALAAGRVLWGNAPDVLRGVREPILLAHALIQRGLRAPHVILPEGVAQRPGEIERWILKPRVSGGGHGVRRWHPDEPVRRGHYLQEYIAGTPASVVFVAACGRGVALGTSRQLIGESAFGVSEFRYCGSILTSAIREEIAGAAIALVDAVTDAFPLVGVGSVDVIASGNELRPVEVNPRWSASMELVERAQNVSLFGLHAEACARGVLPEFDLRQRPETGATHGKAIVFARHDVVIGDTRRWLDDSNVRDIPRPGDRIEKGQPICTVFAVGSDDDSCYANLVERAERIYSELA